MSVKMLGTWQELFNGRSWSREQEERNSTSVFRTRIKLKAAVFALRPVYLKKCGCVFLRI